MMVLLHECAVKYLLSWEGREESSAAVNCRTYVTLMAMCLISEGAL